MQNYSKLVGKMQQVQRAPWRERSVAFAEIFTDPMTLIIGRFGDRAVRSLIALCDEEIAPLMAKFHAPFSPGKSPFQMSDVQIETSAVSIGELCEERDPRNGNAQEGLGKDILSDLLNRFWHLKDKDVSEAESWVWLDQRPYPIIDGKLHYLAQKYAHCFSEGDAWFEMPLRERYDLIHYHTDLDFVTPKRFALSMPNGFMRAFDVNDGFIGPEDFVWLKALPTSFQARASFEGIRTGDLKNMPRSLAEANAGWKSKTERFDRGDEPPRITGTHAYGPGWEKRSLVRVTPQGHTLVPDSCTAVKRADHMIALGARDGTTLDGPWNIFEDGALQKGPSLGKAECPWWGFSIREGHDARDYPVEHWRAVLRSTCDFAAPIFLEPPQPGPHLKSLVAPIADPASGDRLWGAICPETGQEIIPFKFMAYEDVSFGNDCMIFTDAQDHHHVFDENGTLALGPLKTFEVPKKIGSRKHAAFLTHHAEEDRRCAYIRHDLPWMFKMAKANARFGDLDRHAPTLASYAGRLTDGRKDAELAGLWYASVEIVRDGETHGVSLKKGMQGHISFGDSAQFGGASIFNWEKELPVAVLNNSGRVVGIPFDMLRIYKPPLQGHPKKIGYPIEISQITKVLNWLQKKFF